MGIADLRHCEERILGDRSLDSRFPARCNGRGHTVVHALVNEEHKHLQVSYRETAGSACRDYHLCCCNGYSR